MVLRRPTVGLSAEAVKSHWMTCRSIAPGWVGHRIDKGEDDPHVGEQPQ
jgi:hypothetical protein